MNEDTLREVGFALFKTGTVRRLSPTQYVVKASSANGWNLIELKDGVWTCDCNSTGTPCLHVYSTQLHRYASKGKERQSDDEIHLKCKYCSSIDVASCGFRYRARRIARRYFCRDCQRKFSIPYVDRSTDHLELGWLLNEIGMLTTKLTELLSDLNDHMKFLENSTTSNGASGTSDLGSENRKS